MPPGLTFVSSSASQGSYNSATGLWSVGSVNSGGSAALQIVATVSTSGISINTAEIISAGQADLDSTPNNQQPGEDDQASVIVNAVQNSGVRLHGGVLEIIGTSSRDVITVNQNRGRLIVSGTLAGNRFNQSFIPAQIQRISAFLGDGNDSLSISSAVWAWSIVDAGTGNDTVTAGRGSAIILGGEGNDILKGGSGRDILIGGNGADQLSGGGGADLVIAGSTAFDANDGALFAIQQEWNSTRTLAQRMDNLRAGTGPVLSPLTIKLKPSETVFDDAHVDTLFGGADLDWFFLDTTKDKLKDRARQELIS